MALQRAAKQKIVSIVRALAETSQAAITAEYRGLTVAELTRLRAAAREAGVVIRVIPNTLTRRALEGTQFVCLQSTLVGPLLFAFSQTEPSACARLLRDFAKAHDKLVVKALAFEAQLLSAQELNLLAELPTRPEALSRLLAVMKAPLQKLVHTLNAPASQLVRLLAAVRDKPAAQDTPPVSTE